MSHAVDPAKVAPPAEPPSSSETPEPSVEELQRNLERLSQVTEASEHPNDLFPPAPSLQEGPGEFDHKEHTEI